jgi:ATP-dependent Lon protease
LSGPKCAWRVKEQQKRVFKSEFRNTHFSYVLGIDGVEQFVSTTELHSDEAIESDPLPPGQVWGVSPGSPETGVGLYRDRGDLRAGQQRQNL